MLNIQLKILCKGHKENTISPMTMVELLLKYLQSDEPMAVAYRRRLAEMEKSGKGGFK